MKRTAFLFFITLILSAPGLVRHANADTFGSGANSFQIDFVTIGNPGNPADTTGSPQPVAGSVPYEYRIGKYEISEQMIEKANSEGGLGITKDSRGADKPATSVDWFEAAKFVNWLNTSTGSSPAYKFDAGGNFQFWQPADPGYNANNVYRNSLATYFLPSVHEWYKAAYSSPTTGTYFDYPTGSNSPPTAVASGTASGTAVYHQSASAGPADIMSAGGLSPYGTMAQGGNVDEWEETDLDLINDSTFDYRGSRGGSWSAPFPGLAASARAGQFPSIPSSATGFRIGSIVPEPSAIVLFGITLFGVLGTALEVRHLGRFTFFVLVVLVLNIGPFVVTAAADTFGSGANSFQIDFVTIGNPGNAADTTGSPNPAGSVSYEYRIGKYEISEQMIDKANAEGALGITKDTRGVDKPATSVDWFEAAQFVNWLNTSSGSSPAYKFDGGGNFQLWEPSDPGYDPINLYRNSLATYFLPSVHEWYKAAYYDPVAGVYWNYATGSNAPLISVANGTASGTAVYNQDISVGPADITLAGGLSPYGTMAQGGNVNEWQETELDGLNNDPSALRAARGGAWGAAASSLSASTMVGAVPSHASPGAGFRIGSIVPEPTTLALLAIGWFGIIVRIRRV